MSDAQAQRSKASPWSALLLPCEAAINGCDCRANAALLGCCIPTIEINERLIFPAVWNLHCSH